MTNHNQESKHWRNWTMETEKCYYTTISVTYMPLQISQKTSTYYTSICMLLQITLHLLVGTRAYLFSITVETESRKPVLFSLYESIQRQFNLSSSCCVVWLVSVSSTLQYLLLNQKTTYTFCMVCLFLKASQLDAFSYWPKCTLTLNLN